MKISDLSQEDFGKDAETNARVRAAIDQGLSAFNHSVRPDPDAAPMTLAAHDADGVLVGGLLGRTAYGWLRVDRLWIDEDHRHAGMGTALLERAEQVALQRGCHGVHLDTHSFQAPGFYERLGYRRFAELPRYPDRDAHAYYMKTLQPWPETKSDAAQHRYRVHDDITDAEIHVLREHLVAFSDQFTPPRNHRELGLCIRDAAGTVAGGITASTVWDWLQIDVLWVADGLRGQGYGHALLVAVEDRGREHGCRHARLNTFEFQAREFYEQHGYRVQSQTDDFPAGHTQYHLVKALS